MFKFLIRFLGSRELSIGLLIAGSLYFLLLTSLWFLNLIPPATFMVWFTAALLAVPFLANVIISLFTRHYAYSGNILFHAAFVIVAIGIGISLVYRFEGEIILTEGGVFWGEKTDYTAINKKYEFARLAPKVSFRLDKIVPEYWGQRLHFTKLDGEISYPAETLINKGTIRLNGGLTINGARIRHTGFGFAPEIMLQDMQNGTIRRQTAVMQIFPPGSEDYLELGSYKIYMQVFSDPVQPPLPPLAKSPSFPPLKKGDEGGFIDKGGTGGVIQNRSMNLIDPIFLVNITWMGQPIYKGLLKKGQGVMLGNTNIKISFSGIKYWLQVEIIKDPGEIIVIIGLIAIAAGLLLRLFPMKL